MVTTSIEPFYTKIKIGSAALANEFPAGGLIHIEISDLNFEAASNYEDMIYELHFRLVKTT